MGGARPLPVVPRPLPDEHLFAWLGRVAGVYDMTVPALLSYLWTESGQPDPPATLSHHPAPETLAVLSGGLRLPVQVLAKLTVPRLRPLWGKIFRTSWTDALPPLYCPVCLGVDEDAGRPHHLRVDWTCALAFHCHVHDVDLQMGCPACQKAEILFHGPPAAARLHCAHCRTRLGRKSIRSVSRLERPGQWPTGDRQQVADHQERHERSFRAFLKAVMGALAWAPMNDAWTGGGDCPGAFRSTLVGLLEMFGMPVRHDGTPLPRRILAQTFRFPWVRMMPSEWTGPDTFATDFASLPAPVRFDLMVAVYAILSGAEGLLSCRQWRVTREDWRVYCMGDPIAQVLGAMEPEAGAEILGRAKQWAPPIARRFSAVQATMQEKEREMREAVARSQDGITMIPITEALHDDRYFFYRKIGRVNDYDLLRVEDVLTAYREPDSCESSVPIGDVLDLLKPLSSGPGVRGTARSCQPAPVPAGDPSRQNTPETMPSTGNSQTPISGTSPNLFMAAARSALSSEAGTRYKRSGSQQRRQAWFRLVKEATIQLEALKAQGKSNVAP